jgi:hypothetical protein
LISLMSGNSYFPVKCVHFTLRGAKCCQLLCYISGSSFKIIILFLEYCSLEHFSVPHRDVHLPVLIVL